jgi:hypothetical protein
LVVVTAMSLVYKRILVYARRNPCAKTSGKVSRRILKPRMWGEHAHAEDAVPLHRQTAISFCSFIPVNSPPRDVFVVL